MLEESKIKLQSRLEEEEQAKAALMGRIQSHWRRHSFAEYELAYLPDRKRESITDDAGSIDSEISNDGRSYTANIDDLVRDYKKNRRREARECARDIAKYWTQAGDLFSAAIGLQRLSPIEMLAGEVAFSTSSLKRLSEQAAKSPGDSYLLDKPERAIRRQCTL
ncbi:kinesin-like protein KIN-7C, mitochondrial [Salvia divinorum]|uniref:Kinesin-like protein KIN-7C, mitochondrial n=1 Tax=Salvia divinorum TaxID=28513 RepID=A0ABD1FU84_SALDI